MTEYTGMSRCPACGEIAVRFREESRDFQHVDGDSSISLSAKVPVGNCEACGLEFTDKRMGLRQQEAVCAHLNLMTPARIEGIRKSLGQSRQQFSELTKIGEASLSRWERGAGIQNTAMDQYLYLLLHVDNVRRLRERAAAQQEVIEFRHIKNPDEKRLENTHFKLRNFG